jgi:hypothetical protein
VLGLRELFRRQRVVEVATDGFLALAEHAEAVAALAAAEARVGVVLGRLLTAGEDVHRIAALLELPAADVRRFLQAAPPEKPPAEDPRPSTTFAEACDHGASRPAMISELRG